MKGIVLSSVLCVMLGVGLPAAYAQEEGAPPPPWPVPAAAKKVTNPVKITPDGLKDAEDLYMDNCASCHGEGGGGDGPARYSLVYKPRNFKDPNFLKETDGEIFWRMSEGRLPMPSWKDQLTDTQRWQLVNYLKTFAAKSAH